MADLHTSKDGTLLAYADEQIRGLVRQTFLMGKPKPLRQIVFAGADERTPVSDLCMQIATALAEEVQTDVCLVGCEEMNLFHTPAHSEFHRLGLLRSWRQISPNLWLIPASDIWNSGPGTANRFHEKFEELNREFAFSVIEGPRVQKHPSASALARCCDGVVLALEAGATRKAAAQKAKESLEAAGANLLGTILCNRSFPIPDAIYRRV
jgi:hypothetical protein